MLRSIVVDGDRLTNIERAIIDLKTIVEQRFDAIDRQFDAIDRRFEAVDRRFEAVDRRFDETQSQLKSLIEDVRDDIRIVAEGHVALERRVTSLENRAR